MRGIEGPAQAVWPIGVAGAGIDKELVRIADGFASRFHDCLIELPVVAPSKWTPADLEGAKALRAETGECVAHRPRLFHQQ